MGYILVDLPGTYSLMAHSAEEGGCAQFYLFRRCGRSDCRMRRHLPGTKSNLVLQTLEITPHVAVCVNLMDEARRKGIQIDLAGLEKKLGVPVLGASARSGKGLEKLSEQMSRAAAGQGSGSTNSGFLYHTGRRSPLHAHSAY